MKARSIVAPILGIAAFFALWELVIVVGDVPGFQLRPPSDILDHLFTSDVHYAKATWQTGIDAGRSVLLAIVIGFAIGALMASFRWFEDASAPVLVLIQVTPWVAYATSVILWLGAGSKPVLFIGTLVCIPAFAYAASSGLRAADPALIELLHCVDASWWETTWRVRLPSALPSLFTAARFAVGLSIAAVYYTQGGSLQNRGLGSIGRRAINAQQPLPLWATAFCAAFLGALALVGLTVAERLLLGWHASQRAEQRRTA